jgi:hypothetical protein
VVLYKNLTSGDFTILNEKKDLDSNLFEFIREIRMIKVFFPMKQEIHLVSEDNKNNDILIIG